MLTTTTCSALALALGFATATAQRIESPPSLLQCLPAQLQFSGGNAPYYIQVLPAGEVSGTPYDVLGPLDASPLTWTVNVPAGTAITLAIRDSTGAINYASPVTVQPGGGDDCVGQSASSGSVSASTSASPSSAASSSAESASSASMSSAIESTIPSTSAAVTSLTESSASAASSATKTDRVTTTSVPRSSSASTTSASSSASGDAHHSSDDNAAEAQAVSSAVKMSTIEIGGALSSTILIATPVALFALLG